MGGTQVQLPLSLHTIYIYMNHIYEKEDGCEIFLNDSDFETVRKRRLCPNLRGLCDFNHVTPSSHPLTRSSQDWNCNGI
ncbi:hypothetical protein KIN20_038367 [Parelaphostrongylus tenuis]|uniref:Uncharacterized protein n=1 Tax=Parelaphostrongylus tenuis TaxID=148309 RepID=A0AAD5WLQ6_PARTN|nr:hypothetical protein KIN20_038367 [Parelaphostrongylus tenuis]